MVCIINSAVRFEMGLIFRGILTCARELGMADFQGPTVGRKWLDDITKTARESRGVYGLVGQTRVDQGHVIQIWYNPTTRGKYYYPCYLKGSIPVPYSGPPSATFDAAYTRIERSLEK